MIAGVNLRTDGVSKMAVLGDEEIEILDIDSNMDIVEALNEDVSVIAVNAPLTADEGLSEGEEELIDEGYRFSPSTHNTDLKRRAMHLKQLFVEEGVESELIRFDPMITARELAIDGDQAVESYGVDSSDISGSDEFDAVIGAITARFYEKNQVKDLGIQVPEPLRQNT